MDRDIGAELSEVRGSFLLDIKLLKRSRHLSSGWVGGKEGGKKEGRGGGREGVCENVDTVLAATEDTMN